jgi:hypothetical protein
MCFSLATRFYSILRQFMPVELLSSHGSRQQLRNPHVVTDQTGIFEPLFMVVCELVCPKLGK